MERRKRRFARQEALDGAARDGGSSAQLAVRDDAPSGAVARRAAQPVPVPRVDEPSGPSLSQVSRPSAQVRARAAQH